MRRLGVLAAAVLLLLPAIARGAQTSVPPAMGWEEISGTRTIRKGLNLSR